MGNFVTLVSLVHRALREQPFLSSWAAPPSPSFTPRARTTRTLGDRPGTRVPLPFAIALVLAACHREVPAYPYASAITWVQPTSLPKVQTVKLRDGARIDYVQAEDDFGRLTVSGGGLIRCVEATGAVRWMLTDPTLLPKPWASEADHRLAGAFSFDRDQRSGPVGLTWGEAALAADDARLYVVQFRHSMNGAAVVALDLRTANIAWSNWVEGIGRVRHSRYSSMVEARMIDGALVIFGDEAGGDYIEVFSPEGERLSTKVLDR